MCFGDARDETLEQGELWHYGVRQAFGPLLLVRGLETPRTILSSGLAWLLLALLAWLEWLVCKDMVPQAILGHDKTSKPPTLHKVMMRGPSCQVACKTYLAQDVSVTASPTQMGRYKVSPDATHLGDWLCHSLLAQPLHAQLNFQNWFT